MFIKETQNKNYDILILEIFFLCASLDTDSRSK